MRIKKIIKELKEVRTKKYKNHVVKSIETNSKQVTNNAVFVAILGTHFDGHDFIDEAISNGAKSIIYDSEVCDKKEGINYFKVYDTKKALSFVANTFYRNITKKVKLIGVTGTNGKTSITTILHNYLEYVGKKSLLIGTNGIYFNKTVIENVNTTPDILFSLKHIKKAYKNGARYVVMEVSSHAIKELRVDRFDFDVAIFSNLTHDHLDYHKSIVDYRYTKGIFLQSLPNNKRKTAIANGDDDSFRIYNRMIKNNLLTYGIRQDVDYRAMNVDNSAPEGVSFRLLHNDKKYKLKTFLLGEFNVYNILSCIACINFLGFKIETFISFLKIFRQIDGRMEMFEINKRFYLIDFAHTPDSVQNILKNIRKLGFKRMTVIIGCGGNRDRKKREIIGKLVVSYADKVIFTSDNPRDEDEMSIIQDIVRKIPFYKKNYGVILNRERAIEAAIAASVPKEIIIILGKGFENFQIIKGKKYKFNDKEVVKKYAR